MAKLLLKKFFWAGFLFCIANPVFASGLNADIVELEPVKVSELNDLQIYNMKISQELINAVDAKKLLVPPQVEIQLNQMAVYGSVILNEKKTDESGQEVLTRHRAFASKDLLDLLSALVKAPELNPENPFSITSLIRFGGAHGEIQKNGDVIGRAVDIDYFAGNKIHMENPGMALEGILNIIKKFPPLRYSIGLPRPEGGNKINPEKDFFLPVNNLNQARRSPTGNIKGDLNEIKNEDARKKLTETIEGINAEILFLYPDGVNHIHIKTVEQFKPQ